VEQFFDIETRRDYGGNLAALLHPIVRWEILSPIARKALHLTLNLGDANTGFARYVGQAAGADSIFFKWSYALSLDHLKDLLFMGWWSGSLPTLAAALVLTSLLRVGRTSPSNSDDPDP